MRSLRARILGVAVLLAQPVAPPPAAAAPVTWHATILHNFGIGKDGIFPNGGMIHFRDRFFGTTRGGATSYGTIFRLNDSSFHETLLHNFTGGQDGGYPTAGLIVVGNVLFGTTEIGGSTAGTSSSGFGVIFAENPNGTNFRVVYNFAGGTADGRNPVGGIAAIGTTLYGTTTSGGAYGHGTVWAYDLLHGTERVVYSFKGGNDGASPIGGLLVQNGKLFGTTRGGAGVPGTLFSIDPASGAETAMYVFSPAGPYGASQAGLLALNGLLYGTLPNGGVNGSGSVFAFDPARNVMTTVYSFPPIDKPAGGVQGLPYAGLIASDKGAIYGTTLGQTYCNPCSHPIINIFTTDNSVFVLNPTTGAARTIYTPGIGGAGQVDVNQPELLFWRNSLYLTTTINGTPSRKQYCAATGCGTVVKLSR